MEEIFENSFLDELFKTRKNDYEAPYLQKYGKNYKKEMAKKEERLKDLIKNSVKDEKMQREILEQYEAIEQEKRNYWNNAYYKIGIIDGVKFVREVKKMYEL